MGKAMKAMKGMKSRRAMKAMKSRRAMKAMKAMRAMKAMKVIRATVEVSVKESPPMLPLNTENYNRTADGSDESDSQATLVFGVAPRGAPCIIAPDHN
ncbi:MAG: hypothetical protein GY721_14315 [Deltaproteobacteria bacterium]|nr:hypothetical protein [Deltaproteobacteria bacterium]